MTAAEASRQALLQRIEELPVRTPGALERRARTRARVRAQMAERRSARRAGRPEERRGYVDAAGDLVSEGEFDPFAGTDPDEDPGLYGP